MVPLRTGEFCGTYRSQSYWAKQELWITQLEEDNGGIRNLTEFVKFDKYAYITWESERLSPKEWIAKAEKTIFIKKDNRVHYEGFKYGEKFNVTSIVSGILRKKMKYEFQTSLHSDESLSLLHVLLPKMYIPENASFSETEPEFIKKQSKRIALTWPFLDELRVKFQFRKANKKEFDQYRSRGVPRRMRLDSDLLREVKRRAKVEAKDVLAKTAAEIVK